MRRHRIVVLTSCVVAALAASTAVAAAAPTVGTPGAAGAGDPYFPLQGNGGYHVTHYDLDLDYLPSAKRLSGTTTVSATTTQSLSRFDLDLRSWLVVSAVRVNGRVAGFAQNRGQELVITPAAVLAAGSAFMVAVTYAGTARPATDPDGSPDGFVPTSDGAFVAGEPQGAPTWFPCNDTPRDKATFTVRVGVPAGLTAVSNGTLRSTTTAGGTTRTTWGMTDPISTYLVTATIGRFAVTTGATPGGIPYYTAVTASQQADSAKALAALPAIVDWFGRQFGPYPFGSTGAIVDDAPDVGYALETATRPLFDRAPDVATMSHELAHQWFGDSVTLTRWRDIWLAEGFAEFSSWLWDEHTGGMSTSARLDAFVARPASDAVWTPAPANPGGPDQIFSDAVYERGAATLAALRRTVGDPVFFRIMKGWAAAHRHGSATVDQFRAYAASVAGRDLTALFRTWLDVDGKPSFS